MQFLRQRSSGEVVLIAIALGILVFVCGIMIGRALGSL